MLPGRHIRFKLVDKTTEGRYRQAFTRKLLTPRRRELLEPARHARDVDDARVRLLDQHRQQRLCQLQSAAVVDIERRPRLLGKRRRIGALEGGTRVVNQHVAPAVPLANGRSKSESTRLISKRERQVFSTKLARRVEAAPLVAAGKNNRPKEPRRDELRRNVVAYPLVRAGDDGDARRRQRHM